MGAEKDDEDDEYSVEDNVENGEKNALSVEFGFPFQNPRTLDDLRPQKEHNGVGREK